MTPGEGLYEDERCLHGDVVDAVERLLVRRRGGRRRVDACVVHEDVDAALPAGDDDVCHVLEVRQAFLDHGVQKFD
jgi:hypothetical protein